eukprot:m.299804 g.299804  ORF g.299804 m.299804 type:complete len:321 (-) comp55198_c0_seq1:142-1104(-)
MYRQRLPQLGPGLFLTDAGIETVLMFEKGVDLPLFASVHLLRSAAGIEHLNAYFRSFTTLAATHNVGVVVESATWRASADWALPLAFTLPDLQRANRHAVRLLHDLRADLQPHHPFVISACIGPRGDGYVIGSAMTAAEAEAYHAFQVEVFAQTEADLITAITMNYVEEAIGIVRAAKAAKMPVVVSFTVETNGALPSGQPLGHAIEQVDAATDMYAAYFMINCAHPSHIARSLQDLPSSGSSWVERVRGIRPNASKLSHAELNECTELDAGNPEELGQECASLKLGGLPNLTVFGGCCGTNEGHMEEIVKACLPLFQQP